VTPDGRHLPRHRRRYGRAALLAVAAALSLAACGEDGADEGADSSELTAPDATSPDTASSASAPDQDTTVSETTETTEPTEATGATGATGTTGGSGDQSPARDATVSITETDLGPVLGDAAGQTLYVFIPDAQGPSTCVDACLGSWPALIGPATATEGVDEELLGTATRPDGGGEQVTYNGWPLYYFAADIAAGDVSGQGLGDVWFVIDAAGEPVRSP